MNVSSRCNKHTFFLLLVVVNQYTLRSILTINPLQLSDNGTYQCIASNVNATTFSVYHLNFYGMYFSSRIIC